MKKPTPTQIKQARLAVGLTQRECANIVHRGIRVWQKWESGEHEMPAGEFELFLIKTGQTDYIKTGS